MIISSRTPEGEPNRCPICREEIWLDPSQPTGDAPCPNCGHLLWFSDPPIAVVTFTSGEVVDESSWDQLMHLGTARQPPRLLLNVENISLPSSTALTQLVVLNRKIKEQGGRLVLCNISPNLNELFKIMRVRTRFEIYSDQEAAFKALAD
ncbi:STAS domain-containing protein [Roseiconus nitratireducens]|uniref:STAS domain-containing protein n=1 Tax=Roseiconus nitratireducens TaxID=2605748 RepID=A0A5M6D447_9BACT|nr:STAS domain-containing protein [Roseiconus nitratireducens]KAA5542264.1 STAS domain-containing protein [Roseiconus nitratireducens]